MNAITQTEARAINTAAAIPLEAADPTKNLILVPLSRLVSRPTGRNVRKAPRMSIPELAASIQRVRQAGAAVERPPYRRAANRSRPASESGVGRAGAWHGADRFAGKPLRPPS